MRFKFCAFMTLSLLLVGCGAQNYDTAQSGSDNEPYATQQMDLEGLSPLEAHMRARKMVDPKDTRPTHEYTRLVIPPGQEPPLPAKKPRRQPKFMTALTDMIKPQAGKQEPEKKFELSPPPVSKPVAYKMSSAGIPTPPLKPRVQSKTNSGSYAPAPDTRTASHAQSGRISVNDVRLGHHPDKTRVVFDLTGQPGFSHVMSADQRLLTIRLSDARWSTSFKRNYFDHPYISGYAVKSEGADIVIRITMKRPVTFMKWAALPPNNVGNGNRIYFDIKPV